ncbi:uncharacterized protein LOC124268592 [Haliotis rubra]|uniref:uncharacterized protein LOC124268592 n=1 Tax=Haliotis rubra TaxID=36100 RepID=UPI001EE51975|nr:uncharacterized protein LOC124268592 [Haliotis rubra]
MSGNLNEGTRMSLYGKSYLSPDAKAGLWKNALSRYGYIRRHHLSIKGDGSELFTGETLYSQEMLDKLKTSCYGPRTRTTTADVHDNIYDRLFHQKEGFDCKLHRDDRRHILEIGRAVHEEEIKRACPMQSSSEFGRRLHAPLEPFDRKRARIDHVVKGFYYPRGTGLPPVDS